MKYLLDTHTFVWKLVDTKRIPAKVISSTEDPENELFLSAVSLWEIAIKTRRKKLQIGVENIKLIDLAERMGIQVLPLLPDEAASYGDLIENTHFDPFDRMLIWQAIQRKITLVSADRAFQKFVPYGLDLFWD